MHSHPNLETDESFIEMSFTIAGTSQIDQLLQNLHFKSSFKFRFSPFYVTSSR